MRSYGVFSLQYRDFLAGQIRVAHPVLRTPLEASGGTLHVRCGMII